MEKIPNNIIDWDVLNEIISMDEDDPGFSKELISQYFEQANQTFNEMSGFLDTIKENYKSSAYFDIDSTLMELSNLGHFLKGSSSALGLIRISHYCESIQNAGKKQLSILDNHNNNNNNSSNMMDCSRSDNNNDFYIKDNGIQDTNVQYVQIIDNSLQNARIEFINAKKELQKYYGDDLQ